MKLMKMIENLLLPYRQEAILGNYSHQKYGNQNSFSMAH